MVRFPQTTSFVDSSRHPHVNLSFPSYTAFAIIRLTQAYDTSRAYYEPHTIFTTRTPVVVLCRCCLAHSHPAIYAQLILAYPYWNACHFVCTRYTLFLGAHKKDSPCIGTKSFVYLLSCPTYISRYTHSLVILV